MRAGGPEILAAAVGLLLVLPASYASSTDQAKNFHIQDIELDKVWVRPGEAAGVTIHFGNIQKRSRTMEVSVYLKIIDRIIVEKPLDVRGRAARVSFATDSLAEGGYVIEAEIRERGRLIDRATEVLSIVRDVSDDLRYGFYASWSRMGADYDRKADYFSRLHINAIEFYDYFPAHGYYAPMENEYKFEPFGNKILVEDVRRKIESARKRNILSIAYVAAYSAAPSVYKQFPYPLTDQNGVPRIFNQYVMTETEANRQKKAIWFYLMAIARDSKWYPRIMDEFHRTLDDGPDDRVSFDGFEIDSYGHAEDDRYYSAGSSYNGRLLRDVIMEFVSDVRDMTHRLKDKPAVSFNCVDEFGIEKMYDSVDFLFIENWSKHRSGLEDLVDLCYRHRQPRRQRVVIKIYPADTKHGKSWPAGNLRYILGAAMTGGGSVMVAGEPDESRGEMHALNSLYYPDHASMPEENYNILRNYHMFDALLYRLSHGKNVRNLETGFHIPGCIVRAFESDEKFITVQILHAGDNRECGARMEIPAALEDYEITFEMPSGRTPVNVYYGTPDSGEMLIPRSIKWEFEDGRVRAVIPELSVYGALLIDSKP